MNLVKANAHFYSVSVTIAVGFQSFVETKSITVCFKAEEQNPAEQDKMERAIEFPCNSLTEGKNGC